MGDEETVEVKKSELEELIEKKVEERLQERLDEQPAKGSESKISRRNFLKKAGFGALGFGALSLLPSASALDVRSSSGLEVFDDGNEYLQVQNGEVDVLGGASLDLNSNNIKNVNQLNGQDADDLGGVSDHSNLSNVTAGQHRSDSNIVSTVDGQVDAATVGGISPSNIASAGGGVLDENQKTGHSISANGHTTVTYSMTEGLSGKVFADYRNSKPDAWLGVDQIEVAGPHHGWETVFSGDSYDVTARFALRRVNQIRVTYNETNGYSSDFDSIVRLYAVSLPSLSDV